MPLAKSCPQKPSPPVEPASDACCGEGRRYFLFNLHAHSPGCRRCIWDIHAEKLELYEKLLREYQAHVLSCVSCMEVEKINWAYFNWLLAMTEKYEFSLYSRWKWDVISYFTRNQDALQRSMETRHLDSWFGNRGTRLIVEPNKIRNSSA